VNDVKRYQITLKLHEMYCKKCIHIETCVRAHNSFEKMVKKRTKNWQRFAPEYSSKEEERTYQECFESFNGGAK